MKKMFGRAGGSKMHWGRLILRHLLIMSLVLEDRLLAMESGHYASCSKRTPEEDCTFHIVRAKVPFGSTRENHQCACDYVKYEFESGSNTLERLITIVAIEKVPLDEIMIVTKYRIHKYTASTSILHGFGMFYLVQPSISGLPSNQWCPVSGEQLRMENVLSEITKRNLKSRVLTSGFVKFGQAQYSKIKKDKKLSSRGYTKVPCGNNEESPNIDMDDYTFSYDIDHDLGQDITNLVADYYGPLVFKPKNVNKIFSTDCCNIL
eukprot:468124_1